MTARMARRPFMASALKAFGVRGGLAESDTFRRELLLSLSPAPPPLVVNVLRGLEDLKCLPPAMVSPCVCQPTVVRSTSTTEESKLVARSSVSSVSSVHYNYNYRHGHQQSLSCHTLLRSAFISSCSSSNRDKKIILVLDER